MPKFYCKYCDFRSNREFRLNEHIKEIHINELLKYKPNKNKKKLKIKFINWWSNGIDDFFLKFIRKFIYSNIIISDNPDILFCSVFGEKSNIEKYINNNKNIKLKIFFTGEDLHYKYKNYSDHLLNIVDVALGFENINNPKFIRFPLWLTYINLEEFNIGKESLSFNKLKKFDVTNKNKFCCILNNHDKFKTRTNIFNILNNYKKVDSGGIFKNNINYKIKSGEKNKYNWLKNYKFNICCESCIYNGYITEKLFESLIAGCIPIYYTENMIEEDIINNDIILKFNQNNINGLVKKIKELDTNYEKYKEFTSQNILTSNAKNNIIKYYNKLQKIIKHYIPRTVAFWENCLTERGTTIALYDYAYYNQTILNNKSIIFYDSKNKNNDTGVINKFKEHFNVFPCENFNQVDEILINNYCETIYHIEGGDQIYINSKKSRGLKLSKIAKNCIHCVFNCNKPHGEIYTSISPWIQGNNGKFKSVPHMINLPNHNNDMREELNIPKDAIVFGSYGGKDSFNIDFVHKTIYNIASKNKNIYFIFANFNKFCNQLPNIIHLDKIIDLNKKVKFINTTDAMIHAQKLGETFGLAIGEFSSKNKPIISTKQSLLNNFGHVKILGNKALWYSNEKDLTNIILNFDKEKNKIKDWNAFKEYTPEKVMKIFNDVFLMSN